MLARASRSRRRTWAATAALTVGLVALGAPGASAHDQLISTDPADGAVLAAPPSELSVTFSEPVLNISPTIAVTGPDGPVTTSVAVTDTVVTATLPEGLADGDYTVAWRVVSSDGHPVQGSFTFTIQAAPPATGTASTPTSGRPRRRPCPRRLHRRPPRHATPGRRAASPCRSASAWQPCSWWSA